ncbi:hypothetical protein [Peribacillus frigoritolerans]|uniref:Uncharacterized protein n=1 Tax=Peribacillus castrilensis TaxID=2897690 RepID=A0AAW9N3V4_9BACI|nr:hypothetical protein [Peribacillus castrilensis]MEC0347039.1 hypothetical protein [Peribacillus castrilensis]
MNKFWTHIDNIDRKKGLYLIIAMFFSIIHIYIFYIYTGVLVLLFAIKAIRLFISLRRLDFLDINEKGYKTDRQKRGEFLIIISVFTFIVILFLSYRSNLEAFWNSIHGTSLICISICLGFSGLAIYFNNFFLRFVGILCTTIFGFMALLLVINLILNILLWAMHEGDLEYLNHILSFFEPTNLILSSFLFTEKFLFDFIIVIIYSIVFLSLIILIHPPYQLEQLGNVLKISNIFISVSSTIIFFYVSIKFSSISLPEYKEAILPIIESDNQYSQSLDDLKKYISTFSKANIINMGTVLFTPYIIALLITNFILELKKNNSKNRASKIFEEYIELDDLSKDREIMEKKYFYYTGDKNLWRAYKKLNEK